MAGLDPAIGYPHQFANDAIPVSNHPMEMAGSNPAMTWLRAVRQQLGPLVRDCIFRNADVARDGQIKTNQHAVGESIISALRTSHGQ